MHQSNWGVATCPFRINAACEHVDFQRLAQPELKDLDGIAAHIIQSSGPKHASCTRDLRYARDVLKQEISAISSIHSRTRYNGGIFKEKHDVRLAGPVHSSSPAADLGRLLRVDNVDKLGLERCASDEEAVDVRLRR
jgi:hypothetical protein